MFSFIENSKVKLESNLEELLQYSYGMMQKKKASQIIEKELGHSIYPMTRPYRSEYTQKANKNRGREYQLGNNKQLDECSASMM